MNNVDLLKKIQIVIINNVDLLYIFQIIINNVDLLYIFQSLIVFNKQSDA